MAVRKKTKATARAKPKKKAPPSGPSIVEEAWARIQPYQREIMGGVLIFLSVITLLSLLSLTEGSLSGWWGRLFSQLFGWGAIPAAVLVGSLGALLTFGRLKEEEHSLPLDVIIGVELLFAIALTLLHLMFSDGGDSSLLLARQGAGGGFVGWGLSTFLVDLIGVPLTGIALFLLGLSALGLLFRVTVEDATGWAESAQSWVHPDDDEVEPREEVSTLVIESDAEEIALTPEPLPATKVPLIPKNPKPAPEPPAASKKRRTSSRRTKANGMLPPLDLLAPPMRAQGQNLNARYQAQIIEETLQGFGIPAEVVEINEGPTVVQFGLKLGTIDRKLADGNVVPQRIRVSKIVALSNDLALALSAAPIRIEAPVPGRPLVGIEVPNTKKTMVTLRAVLEDKSFNQGGPLQVALGQGVSGQAVSAPLAKMPHVLIAGATGSGKSVCLNTIITTLLITHGPDQLRFLMIDPKMVELTSFNGIPHLIAPVVTDFEQVVGALAWVTREMERRYKLFAAGKARSITGYNSKVEPEEKLPYLVVVIDELADLMMMAPDEVERSICRIAQMARATGIHLVIATQRPSTDVVTGLIKANFPTRIAFAVSSQIDSRVILDSVGAERLLGQGDMLYQAPDSPKLQRLQGCFASDEEIKKVVNHWIATRGTPTQSMSGQEDLYAQAKLPWADIIANADKDDLLEDAVKIVVDNNRASTSLLQRRLGIGYPRASRLIDQLEDEGIIGPADGSRPRKVLLTDEKDEADYAEFEQDVAEDEPIGPPA